jgi:hypothetical protein
MNDDERSQFFKAFKEKAALSEQSAYLHPLSEGSIPRVDDNANVLDARTTSVSPSAPRPLTYDPVSGSGHGRGNENPPLIGSILPKTSGGAANANPNPLVDDTLARTLAQQLKEPVVMPTTQEKIARVDRSQSPAVDG